MKYVLIKEDSINFFGQELFRIKRISTGELGGYIESERNLSQRGNAWVSGNAKVSGNAEVFGNAKVFGNAEVSGNAEVFGNAKVFGNAEVFGNAKIKKFNEVINLTNLPFIVTFTPQHITIGCQTKSYGEWIETSKEQAEELGLDPKYFDMFMTLIKTLTPYVLGEII